MSERWARRVQILRVDYGPRCGPHSELVNEDHDEDVIAVLDALEAAEAELRAWEEPGPFPSWRAAVEEWRARAEAAETELKAELTAALALADEWAAVDGNDQRAATLHAVADNLRAVLGKSGQPASWGQRFDALMAEAARAEHVSIPVDDEDSGEP